MKTIFRVVAALLALVILTHGQAPPPVALQYSGDIPLLKKVSGVLQPITNASVKVCQGVVRAGDTCTPATVYSDPGGLIAIAQAAAANSNFGFWAGTGIYTVVITSPPLKTYYSTVSIGNAGPQGPTGPAGTLANNAGYNGTVGLNTPDVGVFTDLVGKFPKIDVRAFGASGSGWSSSASCTSGASTVNIGSAGDYINGEGVHFYHCGAAVTLSTPAAPSTSVTGTTGSTSHTYQIAALTDNGGETAASTVTTVSNGIANASMSFANYTTVSWPAVAGAKAYAVYKDGTFVNLIGVPGWAQYWVKNRPYHVGDYVQPAVFNGHYYQVTVAAHTNALLIDGGTGNGVVGSHVITPKSMAGIVTGQVLAMNGGYSSYKSYDTVTAVTATTFTAGLGHLQAIGFTIDAYSGATEPTWCTTAGCTVTLNGITYTEQPFTHVDVGQGAWGGSPVATVAYNAPVSALADSLITSISSGAGTTSLTVADAAGASVIGTTAVHDDTVAINAANTFAHTKSSTEQAYNGAAAAQYASALYFPYGKYRISAALTPQTTNIYSDGQAMVEQTIPTKNLFDMASGYMMTLENLSLRGGWTQIRYQNGNVGGIVTLKGLNQENCWDYALNFQESPGGDNDNHLSTFINWKNSQVQGCKRLVYNTADQFVSDGVSASYNDFNNDAAAQFVNGSGALHITNFFASPGKQLPGSRWIDNRSTVVVDGNSRFGGEGGGGWPLIYNFLDYSFTPGTGTLVSGLTYTGQKIVVRDSPVCVGSGTPEASIVNLRDSVPSSVDISNITCAAGNPFVKNGGSIDLDFAFMDPTSWQILTPPTFQWNIGANQAYTGITTSTVPAQIMPYLGRSDLSLSAAPTSGNWRQGQVVVFSGTLNEGTPAGWVNTRSGKAAPVWLTAHAYSVGDFVVPATDNGHVYIAAVAGTSGTTPTWSTTAKSVTSDNGISWIEAGVAALFKPYGFTGCADGYALCLNAANSKSGIELYNGNASSTKILNAFNGSATSIFAVTAWDGNYTRIESLGSNGLVLGAPSGKNVELGNSGAVKFTGSGVNNDGSGLKHARVSTGSVAAGARADATVTWTTGFANTSYTPVCTVTDTSAAGAGLVVERIRAVATGTITVQVYNAAGGAITGTLDCWAVHD
jgi:hypothetical protein